MKKFDVFINVGKRKRRWEDGCEGWFLGGIEDGGLIGYGITDQKRKHSMVAETQKRVVHYHNGHTITNTNLGGNIGE